MKHDAQRASAQTIDDDLVKRLADEAEVDKRTIVRRLAGLPVRGRTGARVDRVLAKHGLRAA